MRRNDIPFRARCCRETCSISLPYEQDREATGVYMVGRCGEYSVIVAVVMEERERCRKAVGSGLGGEKGPEASGFEIGLVDCEGIGRKRISKQTVPPTKWQ